MKYLPEILSLLMWPALIVLSYFMSSLALKYFHKKAAAELENEVPEGE